MDSKIIISIILLFSLCVLIQSIEALGEFKPEYHVKLDFEENNGAAKLILDEATQLKLKESGKSVIRLVKESSYTPVVFWHGMGDTAYGSINIDRMALQRKYPGIMVLSVQIGDNSFQDLMGSYFTNMNYQIEQICKEILNNKIIRTAGAFNAVGFSQGGQFLRGLIQRCPLSKNRIRVRNFISLGGQHQGVFGLPNCVGNKLICNHIRYLLTTAAYEPTVQEHSVQAEYWHDPHLIKEYKEKNVFLADINNERNLNLTYKQNLVNLENLVLVQFNEDEMVVPRESSLFGFYEPGQKEKIIPMRESSLYKEDRIGLKQLDLNNRLFEIRVQGGHLQYSMRWFLDEIASVYLSN